ncbi:MAG: hypothetical protein RMI63_05400 [Caldimicrobium sp.]|nr:hypothetical protein [Caldimicrobium sp.]MDW8094443.1 hypothetical protein [Caldimicrobium sp.]
MANFFLYAQVKEKLSKVDSPEEALQTCKIIIVRKRLPSELTCLAEDLGFTLKSFGNKRDSSKSYYIIYNSST